MGEIKETQITEQDKIIFQELNSFLSNYNDFQKKAIISNKEKILCIAGAGTGKTTVLTKRIEFLIKYKEISSEKILAITFTRKAKQEMQKRLFEKNIYPIIETFNSFCEKILKKYQNKIYGQKTKIINYQEKIIALNFVLKNLDLELNKILKDYFSKKQQKIKSKDELIYLLITDCFFILDYFKLTKTKFHDFSEDSEDKKLAKIIYLICKELKRYMKLHGFRTYNDQLLDAIDFFNKNPEKIPEFNHILIDEYQDLNSVQHELTKILNPKNLFVVGDPRQSIFGWRGSDISQILNFNKEFLDTETIILKKNYRSNNHLVDLMNESIKHLKLPDLETEKTSQKKISLKNFETEEQELNFLVERLKKSKLKSTFVLSRTHKPLLDLSEKLKKQKIPHIIKKEDDNFLTENKIILSTIHAIKGLEAEKVFLIKCNEQNFPCKSSDHHIIDLIKTENYNKEKEEKRLFYVALSRAKNELHLTYAGNLTSFITSDMKKKINS